jgi:clathrin heavy chain
VSSRAPRGLSARLRPLLAGSTSPVKKFERHAILEGTQVISYAVSADGNWMMAVGVKKSADASMPPVGCMQLFSAERGVSQALNAHAGTFCTARLEGSSESSMLCVFVEHKPVAGEKPCLRVIEVGKTSGAPFRLGPIPLPLPAGDAAVATDFAVAVDVSRKHDIVYVTTKLGYQYIFDLHTGNVIFRTKVADSPVFTTCYHEATGGVISLTASAGQVILSALNEDAVVPYIRNTLRNQAFALKLAGRLGLSGADDSYKEEFDRLLAAGDMDGAAELAANSPGTVLRNSATIAMFQKMAPPPGGQPPVMKYFSRLMAKGKLNRIESVEIARPALAQGRAALLEKWLDESKLECSADLGDLVQSFDPKIALRIYLAAGDAHEQVISCYASAGEYDKIVPYAREHSFEPNWTFLLQNLVHRNPKSAQEVAIQLVKNEGGPLMQIDAVVDIFMQFHRLQECTSFLLDALSEDRKEQGYLQTRLLEMNLLGGAPQVVDAILSSDMLHHFDRHHIATLCERSGLYQRAMELYEEVADIKRCMRYVAAQPANHEYLVKFFGSLSPEDGLSCLSELMMAKQNESLVVNIATTYSEEMNPEELIKLFEANKSTNGLFFYLGAIVNTSKVPAVHLKYIQAAAAMGNKKEVERVCRDSTVYNPEEVRDFLISTKFDDPRALIHVCDRHGFIEELVRYLYGQKLTKFVEVYVQRVSPKACPRVVGCLLDLDADDAFIKGIIAMVPTATGPLPPPVEGVEGPNVCQIGELVEEVEKRNRLRVLQPWLEQRVTEGNTDPALHNAVGKIYVMTNKDPQSFLAENRFYDPLVLGKYCEKLDPYFAFLAYKRADGACDEQLLEVTSKNGLFKDQARYLVEKRDAELWAKVLSDENEHRSALIEQVTGTALPATTDPDMVSVTVKAFMDAELPEFLIGLLEKLVLHNSNSAFSANPNLQNLLILTAIRCTHSEGARPDRAMGYINRLDKFDGPKIASVALRPEYQLFEEAFTVYKKFKMHVEAADVLLNHVGSLDRAAEYAEQLDRSTTERAVVKQVWTRVARSQLEAGMFKEAVDSYIRAAEPADFAKVISVGHENGAWEDLVRFLEMARKTLKDRAVDTELAHSLAQANRLSDLEILVTAPNVADIQGVGDRCYEQGLFEAARLLFASISNNAMLALALVQLSRFREAVDAAKKANSIRTWKEVNAACVRAKEFRLAQQCGLQIIQSPDHLEELILHYESNGYYEEIIKLLETGVGNEGAHQGIFTELAVLYTKHRPEKLMEHLSIFRSRLNMSRVLRACEGGRHWAEATFLYVESGDFDSAVSTMMAHSPSAFHHDKFLEAITQVRNAELLYRAIEFYIGEQPMDLNKLLQVLTPKLDHARVVHVVKKVADDAGLRLALPYLRDVQKNDITAVNDAVHDILIDEEDYTALQQSVDEHERFDALELAKRLERHDLLEFRRIAARLYKNLKRFEQSIELSKEDNMFKDAIDTAAASASRELAEGLLTWFVKSKHDPEAFAACLYTCYSLIRSDVALELAWRHRIMDFAMPFMIQCLRDLTSKVKEVDDRTKEHEKRNGHAQDAAMEAAAMQMGGGPVLMLENFAHNPEVAGGYHAHPGYGVHPVHPGMPPVPGVMPGMSAGFAPQMYTTPQVDIYTMGGATT